MKGQFLRIEGSIGIYDVEDGMYPNRSYEVFQLQSSPKCKDPGTCIDSYLCNELLCSSVIGDCHPCNRSQSNHAAGNTYQDALARHSS